MHMSNPKIKEDEMWSIEAPPVQAPCGARETNRLGKKILDFKWMIASTQIGGKVTIDQQGYRGIFTKKLLEML